MDTDRRSADLLVIRLWTEVDGGIRMRVTSSTRLRLESERTQVVTSRREAVELVESWLDDVLGPVTRP
ncbi:hypothetical protein [Kribbella sp. NPDC000426]|uniref:hypothetical protein n=1 Tax=Kribbella sp. NPDC000426 TaxID=3154255 RepID=UPI0033226D43